MLFCTLSKYGYFFRTGGSVGVEYLKRKRKKNGGWAFS